MTTLPGTDFNVDLQPDENVLASAQADGYFASEHGMSAPKPYVVLTDRRFIVLTRRGLMKQRLDHVASWPLTDFTERLNSSEGTALGSFMHVVTLFTHGGETVSTGFRSREASEAFKTYVANALGPVLGP